MRSINNLILKVIICTMDSKIIRQPVKKKMILRNKNHKVNIIIIQVLKLLQNQYNLCLTLLILETKDKKYQTIINKSIIIN
jgi:hypothetical protein